jgi:hypothetical protein
MTRVDRMTLPSDGLHGNDLNFPIANYWGIEKASDPLFSHSPQRNKLEVATPRRFGGIPSGLLGKLCPSMEQRNRPVV